MAVCAVLLLVACTRGVTANSVLSEVARSLDRIDSAEMDLTIEAAGGKGAAESSRLVHTLTGKFDLPSPGELPKAEIAYRQTHGQEVAESTFLADGKAAFVKVGDAYYRLSPERADGLRGREAGTRRGTLELNGWVRRATLSRDRGLNVVRGEIDPVRAINDIIEFGRHVGAQTGSLSKLEGNSARQLRDATEQATILVESTPEEHFLRRLRVEISMAAPTKELREALGELGAAEMTFDLSLDKINREVKVTPPSEAREYSELSER